MSLKRMFIRSGLRYDRFGGAQVVYPLERRTKRLLWVLGLLVLLSLAPLWAWWQVRRQLPDFAAPPVPGLQSAVSVKFDGRGVATVQAGSSLDALRVQGYLTARERMFQMELQRRAADGELAAFAGPAALPLDRIHRTYGFRQVAEAAVPLLPEEERQALEALAAGVNAFIATHEERWGLEFRLLGIRPKPWTSADSLKVLLLMHEDLSSSWKDELQAEALAKLPKATRDFLLPVVVEGDHPLVPDLSGTRPDTEAFFNVLMPVPAAKPAKGTKARRAALEALPFALPLGSAMGRSPDPIGSNNWVVGSGRAANKRPLLANDPHLGLQAPGLWFPLRLEFGGGFVQGASLPGLPGIVIGQNERIAWGFTNLGSDVQDLYKEPAASSRHERIEVKDQPPEDFVVAMGAHGPQVREGYSLAWTALDPKNLRFPMGLNRAQDWASFNAALDGFTGPAQNVVYADREGHIGWRATGVLPLRAAGDDGSRPKDGRTTAMDWKGLLPSAQMPRVLDPAEGFIATANHRVIGTSFPTTVTTHWASPSRVRRITEQLARSKELDRPAMEALQRDEVSVAHRELMAAWIPFLPLNWRTRFEAWDGAATVDSERFPEALALTRALRQALLLRLLKGTELAPEDFHWMNSEAMLLAALKAKPEAWKEAGLGDKDEILGGVVSEAEKELKHEPWGEQNKLRIRHPLGRGGALLSWIFDPPSMPQGGSRRSVRVTTPEFGQSMRLLVDWSDPEATTLVLPLGVSGHLSSPHRLDQMEDWLKGDPEGQRTRLVQTGVGKGMEFKPAR
jgi:penicillin amidase